jgi:hypothetical protein
MLEMADKVAKEAIQHMASEKGLALFGEPKRELVRVLSKTTGYWMDCHNGVAPWGDEDVDIYEYVWTQRGARMDLYSVSLVVDPIHPDWKVTSVG